MRAGEAGDKFRLRCLATRVFLIIHPLEERRTLVRPHTLLRGWPWLLIAGLLQPLSMEAYNVADWYWADPGMVRLITLAGPLVVIAAVTVTLYGDTSDTWALIPASLLFWAPWGLIGIEQNWSYRASFLSLQLIMVAMWLETLIVHRTGWMLDLWAKRVGFAFALLGVAVCVLAQFVFAETSFFGTMAHYDPASETASAEVRATGIAASVWIMPLASVACILALTAFDFYRRYRRRRRQWTRPTTA